LKSRSKNVLVVADGCPLCEDLLAALKKSGKRVSIIDTDTPKGLKWADRHNIKAVPECVVVTKDEKGRETVRSCSEDEFKKLLLEVTS